MRFPVNPLLHRLSLSLLLTACLVAWEHQSYSAESPAFSRNLAQVTSADQALLDAVATGRLGDVRVALEQGANPNAGDLYSGYALTSAATLGYTEIVQLLLERGANVDIAADEGYRPLIEALAADQTPIVQLLLERGADPNQAASGITPLEFAIQANNATAVKLLLQAGATVKPNNGHNLLTAAQQQGNAEIIQLIQQAQP